MDERDEPVGEPTLEIQTSLLTPINPRSLGAPRGYANGILAPPGGRLLFVAGQVAWGPDQEIVCGDFVGQFARALDNVIEVVRGAGGRPNDVASLTVYVTDRATYLASLSELGEVWRHRMGRHYPAMALVEVAALVVDEAKVEIQGIAVLRENTRVQAPLVSPTTSHD